MASRLTRLLPILLLTPLLWLARDHVPPLLQPDCADAACKTTSTTTTTAAPTTTTTTTTTSTTTTTLDYPANWTNATGIKAVWLFETTSYGTNSSSNCDSSCNLANQGTPSQDGTNKMQGSYAMSIAAANTAGVDDNSGDDADLHFAGDVGMGCWVRPTTNPVNNGVFFATSNTFQQGLKAGTRFDGGWQGYATSVNCNMANAPATNTWQYAYITHDDTGTAIFHALSGSGTNRTCTTGTASATNTGGLFLIGYDEGGAAGWDGQVDECVYANAALTEAAWCHICSCGIDGQSGGCTCNGSTGYTTEGRNDSDCGGCTLLSDCNAANPPTR